MAYEELAAFNEERAVELNVFGADQLFFAVEFPFKFAK